MENRGEQSLAIKSVGFPKEISALYSGHFDGRYVYVVDHPSSGGNWTIIKIDIINDSIETIDTNLAKPTTDGHYSLRFLLPGSDGYYYSAYARWSSLHVLRFNPNNNWSGEDLGEVQGIPSDLNYPNLVPIRKDKWVMVARGCADGGAGKCVRVLKFNGTIDQITDPQHWEDLGTPINSVGDGLSSCGEGLPHIYPRAFPIDGYKILIWAFQRCHSDDACYPLIIYDSVRDEFYSWKGTKLDGSYKYSDVPDCIPFNTNGNLLEGDGAGNIAVYKNRYVIMPGGVKDAQGNWISMHSIIVDLQAKTTHVINDYRIDFCMETDPLICIAEQVGTNEKIILLDIEAASVTEVQEMNYGAPPEGFGVVYANQKLSYKYNNIIPDPHSLIYTDDTRCNIVDYSIQGDINSVSITATLEDNTCNGNIIVKLIDSNGNIATTGTLNCSNGQCSGSIQANPGQYIVVIEQM